MPSLYIIAGCNGAGKTTASMTLLPEILNIKEFVNADAIAAGLSPFNPSSVSFEAGRLMLQRIEQLVKTQTDFGIETTLSTKSYVNLVKDAQKRGFEVILIYFWLDSVELAKERVKSRVLKGGHSIPENIIERRYFRGIENLIRLFIPICDESYVYDNSVRPPQKIFEKINFIENIYENERWDSIKKYVS